MPLGHPKKLNKTNVRYTAYLAPIGKTPTATAICKELRQHWELNLHRTTIFHYLRSSGLGAYVKCKKPLLSLRHCKARLAFAQKYKNWTVNNCKQVFFSDETKINHFGSDGCQYCWRKHGSAVQAHHVMPTMKHRGGSILIWGCICWDGPGYICQIEGKMTALDYQGILG